MVTGMKRFNKNTANRSNLIYAMKKPFIIAIMAFMPILMCAHLLQGCSFSPGTGISVNMPMIPDLSATGKAHDDESNISSDSIEQLRFPELLPKEETEKLKQAVIASSQVPEDKIRDYSEKAMRLLEDTDSFIIRTEDTDAYFYRDVENEYMLHRIRSGGDASLMERNIRTGHIKLEAYVSGSRYLEDYSIKNGANIFNTDLHGSIPDLRNGIYNIFANDEYYFAALTLDIPEEDEDYDGTGETRISYYAFEASGKPLCKFTLGMDSGNMKVLSVFHSDARAKDMITYYSRIYDFSLYHPS